MIVLLRALFWGLLALWIWRLFRRGLSLGRGRRTDPAEPTRPQPAAREKNPLTNHPIEDADYEELP